MNREERGQQLVPKIRGMTAYVNFDCPCGAWDFVMTDESEPKTCDCGRVYAFSCELKMLQGPRDDAQH